MPARTAQVAIDGQPGEAQPVLGCWPPGGYLARVQMALASHAKDTSARFPLSSFAVLARTVQAQPNNNHP